MRVAVLQSNYLPWKGYFDIINDVDLFIFYDGVQFTKNDWRNRNRIKTTQGTGWLTVPVGQHENRLIRDVDIPDSRWQIKHWKTLKQYYSRAPYFADYAGFFEDVYLGRSWSNLSQLNQHLIRHIAKNFLHINTVFADSGEYSVQGKKAERLMDLLEKVNTTTYVSGPSARNYLSDREMAARGIKLVYKSYEGYPTYAQCHPPFEHGVSIVDMLFHTGERAVEYIWGWRGQRPIHADGT